MSNFNIGLSALLSSQFALDVVSTNIANANSDGYHRQVVHHAALAPNSIGGLRIQAGVEISYVERVRNGVAEATLTNAISDTSRVDQLLNLQRQIEASFLNETASLVGEYDRFFAEITSLSSAPDEPAQRIAVVEAGERLANTLRSASNRLTELRSAVRFQLGIDLDTLNTKMAEVTDLTININNLQAREVLPNAELDNRDALLNDIAELAGIARGDLANDELTLRIGFNSISLGTEPNQFALHTANNGDLSVRIDDSDRDTDLVSGRIVGLLEAYNTTIPYYQGKLDEFATELMRQVDAIHATGLGPSGAFQNLVSNRNVSFINRPLNEAGIAFPVQEGDITIGITDASGARRSEVISIDPAVDSLNDIATRISSVGGLAATVNADTGQLLISSSVGSQFDFTRQLESQPTLTGYTGTSLPTFSGSYRGDQNDTLSFEIDGSGDVGISDDLYVNVYNGQGVLLNRLSIGNGYEAGTPLEATEGVEVSFSRGTIVDTETFSTRVTAEPDQTGFLAAMGFNSFFTGTNAATMQVDDSIIADNDRFANGSSAEIADTDNLFRLGELEKFRGMPGELTFAQYLNEATTEIGFDISSNESLQASLESLKLRLEEDRDAYSGVDVNEELVRLQQYQRSYEAAARVIQTMDQLLEELISILR